VKQAWCARILRIGSLVPVALAALAAAPAEAQAPKGVQYMPRDGAVAIVWMAPEGNVTGYNVYQYEVGTPGGDIGTAKKATAEPVKTTSFVAEGLTNGRCYHFKVSAIVDGKESDQVGPDPTHKETGDRPCAVPQKPVALAGQEGFIGYNIGTNFPGSHSVDANGVITMKASGWDIWEESDGFYFLATPIAGDLTITARVVSGPTDTHGDGWNLGGPMIRETLDVRSRFAMMQVARTEELQFKKRVEAGETPQNDGHARDDNTKRPITVRLQRTGNDFRAFWSDDGTNFEEIGSAVTIENFAREPFVGIALSGHTGGPDDESKQSEMVVDNFRITKP
jgi:hypothetical protein